MQTLTSHPAKIFQGVADRRQMVRLFDRHAQNPDVDTRRSGALHAGEWFEIGEAEHDHMFEILPPSWMRGEMFALREFLTGSITSIFFTLRINGRIRHFHGYCDLSDKSAPDRMKAAIVERENRPVRAMTQSENIEHIWSITHDDYRGYAGERWPQALRGTRTILLYGGREGTLLKRLDDLTEAEIAAKLPVHLRHLSDAVAA